MGGPPRAGNSGRPRRAGLGGPGAGSTAPSTSGRHRPDSTLRDEAGRRADRIQHRPLECAREAPRDDLVGQRLGTPHSERAGPGGPGRPRRRSDLGDRDDAGTRAAGRFHDPLFRLGSADHGSRRPHGALSDDRRGALLPRPAEAAGRGRDRRLPARPRALARRAPPQPGFSEGVFQGDRRGTLGGRADHRDGRVWRPRDTRDRPTAHGRLHVAARRRADRAIHGDRDVHSDRPAARATSRGPATSLARPSRRSRGAAPPHT